MTTANIAANLAGVRARIADAARRSGRNADAVRLVAVTKYVGIEECRALIAAGCRDLGESRPQELWNKAEAIHDEDVCWHLVGHLQRNKARRTLPLVALIHSADSQRLLQSLDEEAAQLGIRPSVLLEVNTSGDEAKHGFSPVSMPPLLPKLADLSHLSVRGLMTMAALEGGPTVARRNFAALRELRERVRAECPPDVSVDELSMGMSGDFEIAVEEGATIVRVGSALFEGQA